MFEELERINERPGAFEFYTAKELWTDEYTSKRMLECHLNGEIDVSSRKTAFIDRSAKWIAEHFGVGEGTKVADFGCGPGLYATRLARTGAGVTGIDFSARSIEYARKTAREEGLTIRYVNEDYLEYETGERFDLVMMIMCDFCAMSPAQRKRMLVKFLGLLNDGGSILFDAYSLKAFEQREEAATYGVNSLDGFWSPEKYYCFINTFKYDDEKVVLDKYTIIEPERTRTVYNWLQYFSRESLANELAESGLKVEEFFSDVAGSPFDAGSLEFAVVAAKV